MGIEPTSSAWKAEVIAIIRCPHPGTRLPDFSVDFKGGEKDCSSLNSSPFVPATSVTRRELFEGFHLPRPALDSALPLGVTQYLGSNMVVGEGFEPSKSVTADLQSAPFGRSGTPPDFNYCIDHFILEWCRLPESNW